jgi:hypothetical protein
LEGLREHPALENAPCGQFRSSTKHHLLLAEQEIGRTVATGALKKLAESVTSLRAARTRGEARIVTGTRYQRIKGSAGWFRPELPLLSG